MYYEQIIAVHSVKNTGYVLIVGPTCLTRLGRNHALSTEPVLDVNLVPDKCLEPRLDAKSGLWGVGVAPDFPLELSQQFLSFASSMGIVMQEDDTITQHARAFASDNFTMAQ
ncbi:hypothetical protein AVEN_261230-1 [Araneus ventricosus]|uniref:Uncharacterized protein n=1 Tax=Araneus ventricosus TaxID=182803 RepID=A0A4Y2GP04_ARAVE|nr:hypothetical protein AVEN_261230-1 [Araneus ventricosus]